ncbi:MAG TPA: glycosyltransferase family 2 protein [Candidatus Binatia bacterium]
MKAECFFGMKVSLIIPALNEAESLPSVIAAVPRDTVTDIIVVDNGSRDDTGNVARRAGARVLYESRRGYGAACWAGFEAAADADIVVFMDGDGSFSPREIPRLTAPIAGGAADLVLGTRTRRPEDARGIPFHARLGNRFVAWLIGRVTPLRATDLGPFRAVSRDLLNRLHMKERTCGWPCEMMIKAAKLGCRVEEVPVSYRERTAGHSKVSGSLRGSVGASLSMFKVVARWSRWSPEDR